MMEISESQAEELIATATRQDGWGLDEDACLAIRRDVRRSSDLEMLGREIRGALNSQGWIRLQKAPTHSEGALIALFSTTATPSPFGNGAGLIYSVTPSPDEGVGSDLSRTTAAFPLHTDSTFLRAPHEIIALGCVEADPEGGDSLFLTAQTLSDAMVEHAGTQISNALRDPVFPFHLRDPLHGTGVQLVPLIEDTPAGPTARYRRDVLERLMPTYGSACEAIHHDALKLLAEVLDDMSLCQRFKLQPGDLLITHNLRSVHGRTPIRPGSKRRLQRIKGYEPEAYNFRMV
ncbi:TauD/TfdA family dioxygenase [Streptomyces nojiriensis]|uniref:TauD/TfdA family dioxygenase n=1 Tax=Streptomyces nojiriensis TaxID=66374 RepID=UPI0035E3B276